MREAAFEPIPAQQCWELLKTVSIGRLALCVRALPAILPVQYYLDGDKIALCVGHYQVPGQSITDTVAAFAADAIDTSTSQGWAVQVLGKLAPPQSMSGPNECGQRAGGQVIHLTPATIAGQRLHLCPFLSL